MTKQEIFAAMDKQHAETMRKLEAKHEAEMEVINSLSEESYKATTIEQQIDILEKLRQQLKENSERMLRDFQ